MSPRYTPVQLVVLFIGATILTNTLLIGVLALKGVPVPEVLGTVVVSSVTGLLGLLAPNTGLVHTTRTARHVAEAGQAAAAAVLEHDGLREVAAEGERLRQHD